MWAFGQQKLIRYGDSPCPGIFIMFSCYREWKLRPRPRALVRKKLENLGNLAGVREMSGNCPEVGEYQRIVRDSYCRENYLLLISYLRQHWYLVA